MTSINSALQHSDVSSQMSRTIAMRAQQEQTRQCRLVPFRSCCALRAAVCGVWPFNNTTIRLLQILPGPFVVEGFRYRLRNLQRTKDSRFDDGFAAADVSDLTNQRCSRRMLTHCWSNRRKWSRAQVMLPCILEAKNEWMAMLAFEQDHRTHCFPFACILVPLTYKKSITPVCSFCFLGPTRLYWIFSSAQSEYAHTIRGSKGTGSTRPRTAMSMLPQRVASCLRCSPEVGPVGFCTSLPRTSVQTQPALWTAKYSTRITIGLGP